ncbi:MAG: leucine-rich repeat domain-containing protein [Butyrivibrio sp.]|nr:leucine-rich repeat domain-containing protein [Butyrivibrio sp.]
MKIAMPKRVLSLTMALAMSVSLVPAFGGSMTVSAAGSSKTITGLGTGSIANPVKGSGQWNYVYYGKYDDESVKYRVLDVDSSDYGRKETMLLDCDNVLYMLKPGSKTGLLEDLNDQGFLDHDGVFTDAERLSIALSKKDARSQTDGVGVEGAFEQLRGSKIFALDPAEATNTTYGYRNSTTELLIESNRKKRTLKGNSLEKWWLRLDEDSELTDKVKKKLYVIDYDGDIETEYTSRASGVSPAFNVERSSILFSSLVSSNTYKLTLIDPALGTMENVKCETNGNIARISFKYPQTSYNENLSFSVVLLKDRYEAGMTVRNTSDFAYIPVDVTSTTQQGSGNKKYNYVEGTFTIPSGYENLQFPYLVSEKIGEATETDYASAPKYFDLNSGKHDHTWEIEYIAAGDDNATIKCKDCGEKYKVTIVATGKEYGEKPSVKVNTSKDLPDEITVSDVIYRDRDGNEIDESEVTEVGKYTAVAVISVKNVDGSEQTEEIANDFQTLPIVLLPSMVKLSEERYIYDGTAKTPEVTVTVKGKELNKDEYEVEYKNNVEPGIATAVVSPLSSNYTEKVTNSFRIVTQEQADKEDKVKDKIDEKRKDDDKDKEDKDLIDKLEDKYKDKTKSDDKSSNNKKDEKNQVVMVNSAVRHNVGEVLTGLGDTYVVTSDDDTDLTVRFEKARSETVSSVTIPSTITVDGNEYRVTEIAANAFEGNKKLKKVTIGENIEKIGEKAFYKCKKLKKVKIETTYLKKDRVGKKAFKKIHKEAKVIVPENKLKSYKKLLKSRGINGDSQKITD